MNGKAFGWQADYSLLTCAGTGAGKGTSVVVPNLLTYPGSAIVIDPKGELADLTAAYRRDVLGQKVVVLDPARSCRKIPEDLRGSYNPLACLEKGDDRTISRARTIAEGLVIPNPQAADPFWDDSARDFIQSVILYMVAMDMAPARRTLTLLRELVGKGDLPAVTALYPDLEDCEPNLPFDTMIKLMFGLPDFGGIIGETAAKLSRSDKVTGSVLATAGKHLDFLKEPELWAVTDHCDDPPRSITQASSQSSRTSCRRPMKPGPVSQLAPVINATTPGPSPCASKAFQILQRQKYTYRLYRFAMWLKIVFLFATS